MIYIFNSKGAATTIEQPSVMNLVMRLKSKIKDLKDYAAELQYELKVEKKRSRYFEELLESYGIQIEDSDEADSSD